MHCRRPAAIRLVGHPGLSGSGAWFPASGSRTSHSAWPELLRGSLLPTIVSELLPGIASQPRQDSDAKEIDRQFADYRDAGYLVPCEKELGLPTATSAFYAVRQAEKSRIVIDYRYVNGSIDSIDLALPAIAELVRGVHKGDLLTKQDMKAGYHQVALDRSAYHLAATLAWSPRASHSGAFQARTQPIASRLTSSAARLSRVRLDDFHMRNGIQA